MTMSLPCRLRSSITARHTALHYGCRSLIHCSSSGAETERAMQSPVVRDHATTASTTPTANARIGASGPLKFKYFDLKFRGGVSGRGGAVRFFFLTTGIDFVEDVVQWDAWKDVKHEAMANGQTRRGYLPVVTLDGRDLTECHALMRRFSKQLGLYGEDVERDYLIDSLADATVSWRWHWASGARGGEAAKQNYIATERPQHYSAFEGFLMERDASGPFTVAFTDGLVFSQLWDDCANFSTNEIATRPRLRAFFKAYIAHPAVATWCEDANPDLAAEARQL